MRRSPAAWYARIVGLFLLLQGVVTGTMLLVDPLDRAVPVILDTTKMVPQHSALHVVTGLLALALLRWGGDRELWWFALGFGLFYTALGVGGLVTGGRAGLELQPFDHSFHLVAGIPGLIAAGLETMSSRNRAVGWAAQEGEQLDL
ncbi:MAG: hypothetical protein QOG87_3089 [Actinomycetota bacterium]